MSGVALMDRSAVRGDVSPVRVIPERCGRIWTVVATHPQAERWAEQNAGRLGYPTYLPLCLVRKRDRVVRSMWRDVLVPLFPGYFFAVVGRDDPWTPLRYAPGVRSLVVYGNRLQYAHAGAVEALQADEDARRTCPTGAPAAWRPGAACRLVGGCFDGAEGVVAELRGDRAVVGLINCGMLTRCVVAVSELIERG